MEEKRTFNELLPLAEAGDSEAQEKIGEAYFYGHWGEPDYKKAFTWCGMAVKSGKIKSLTILGILYLNGYGVVQDNEIARSYFEKASEKEDMKAPRYLAYMCLDGKISGDAFQWFLLGAERGDITSQFCLGEMYENGNGVERNMENALKWYRKSAERGDKISEPAMKALKRIEKEKNRNDD